MASPRRPEVTPGEPASFRQSLRWALVWRSAGRQGRALLRGGQPPPTNEMPARRWESGSAPTPAAPRRRRSLPVRRPRPGLSLSSPEPLGQRSSRQHGPEKPCDPESPRELRGRVRVAGWSFQGWRAQRILRTRRAPFPQSEWPAGTQWSQLELNCFLRRLLRFHCPGSPRGASPVQPRGAQRVWPRKTSVGPENPRTVRNFYGSPPRPGWNCRRKIRRQCCPRVFPGERPPQSGPKSLERVTPGAPRSEVKPLQSFE